MHLAQQIVDALGQLVITLDCNMLCWPSDSKHGHPLPALRLYIFLSMQLVGLRAIPGILQDDKQLIKSADILTTLFNSIDILNDEPIRGGQVKKPDNGMERVEGASARSLCVGNISAGLELLIICLGPAFATCPNNKAVALVV